MNPEVMKPEVPRALPQESEKPVSSFGTRLGKTQHADCPPDPEHPPPARVSFRLEGALLDRDSEPSDQPRDLVQFVGIAILDRLRKPDEALVIAHRRHLARNDRRRWLNVIKLEIRHQVTFAESILGSVVGE